jgi:hypothetical protein
MIYDDDKTPPSSGLPPPETNTMQFQPNTNFWYDAAQSFTHGRPVYSSEDDIASGSSDGYHAAPSNILYQPTPVSVVNPEQIIAAHLNEIDPAEETPTYPIVTDPIPSIAPNTDHTPVPVTPLHPLTNRIESVRSGTIMNPDIVHGPVHQFYQDASLNPPTFFAPSPPKNTSPNRDTTINMSSYFPALNGGSSCVERINSQASNGDRGSQRAAPPIQFNQGTSSEIDQISPSTTFSTAAALEPSLGHVGSQANGAPHLHLQTPHIPNHYTPSGVECEQAYAALDAAPAQPRAVPCNSSSSLTSHSLIPANAMVSPLAPRVSARTTPTTYPPPQVEHLYGVSHQTDSREVFYQTVPPTTARVHKSMRSQSIDYNYNPLNDYSQVALDQLWNQGQAAQRPALLPEEQSMWSAGSACFQ